MMRSTTILLFFALLLSGCQTFYNVTIEFNRDIESGDFVHAEKFLDKNKKFQKPKNILLYYLNKGYVLRQQNKFKESNDYFNKADLHIEDQQRSYGKEALALFTNDAVRPYMAEGYEQLMVHYYKSLNYMSLFDSEGALVEVKRMDLMIQKLSTESKKKSKKLPEAYGFIQNMMGVIYESSGDFNNAFISYRNAYESYNKSATGVPVQLKNDLMNAASAMGFQGDVTRYEEEFGMEYNPSLYAEQQAVVFWENGLGPVKDESSLNFVVDGSRGGNTIYFVNSDLDLMIPFRVNSSQRSQLVDLGVTRVAIPKLVNRRNMYDDAFISLDGKKHDLELIQDVNYLAHRTHDAELLASLSKTLLRFAMKKAAELRLQKENEALGALAMLTNAVSEKADTRNWQTLPSKIMYTRVPVNTESESITLSLSTGSTTSDLQLPINKVTKKKLQFIYHHTTESWGR